jgi:hypothetical protein
MSLEPDCSTLSALEKFRLYEDADDQKGDSLAFQGNYLMISNFANMYCMGWALNARKKMFVGDGGLP